jgi:hypothetical protein
MMVKFILALAGENIAALFMGFALVNTNREVKMTSSNALKCVVSNYEKRSPQQKIGDFTQTKLRCF